MLDRLGDLPGPQRAALGGALGLVPAVERDRFLVGAATLAVLVRASAERPVLACVDDVHWLDAPSLDALLFAGRRLAGAPVGGPHAPAADHRRAVLVDRQLTFASA